MLKKEKAEKLPVHKKLRSETTEAYQLLLPAFIFLAVFMAYPLINSIVMSFQNYKLTSPQTLGTFAAFDNFIKVFSASHMPLLVGNTILFVAVSVALQFVLGLALALTLRKPFRGRNVYQAVVFLPWAISAFIVGLTFRWMFNGEYGPVNDILLKLGIIPEKIAWLGLPGYSLFAIIAAMIWIGVPFFAIMILAALQSIPQDVFEAADIDGAGSFAKFVQITIPYIKPTIIMTLLLRTIWIFNSADLIFVMTNGGPANSSHTLASYMFNQAYAALDFGQAAALGVVFMIILLIYINIFLKVTRYDKAGDF